jgi:hypothetical protein
MYAHSPPAPTRAASSSQPHLCWARGEDLCHLLALARRLLARCVRSASASAWPPVAALHLGSSLGASSSALATASRCAPPLVPRPAAPRWGARSQAPVHDVLGCPEIRSFVSAGWRHRSRLHHEHLVENVLRQPRAVGEDIRGSCWRASDVPRAARRIQAILVLGDVLEAAAGSVTRNWTMLTRIATLSEVRLLTLDESARSGRRPAPPDARRPRAGLPG